MVNLVTAADFHFSDVAPASRRDDYTASLFNKLEQIYSVCKKISARFLLIPGDLFHIKTASKTSHSLVQQLLRKFKSFQEINCRVVAIPGNHDLSYSKLDSLKKQPLGTLASSDALELLSATETEWSQNEIFYQNSNLNLRIVGSAFGEFKEDSLENVTFKKGSEDWLICMSHVFAGPLKTNFFGSFILSYDEMLNLGPDIFVFGHLHKDQNIRQIGNKYFVNVGAVSRGSISEDDIKRTPKISIIQLTKTEVKIRPINLKVLPSTEVFDLTAKQHSDQRFKELNTFIEMLSKEEGTKSQNLQDHLGSLSFAKEVKERALIYLERAK